MHAVVSLTVDVPNGSHAIRLAGSGPSMMVIPGGPGWGAEYMVDSLAELLGDRRRLIFVDQRGTGASPVGTGPLTADAYVEDMEAIADHLDLSQLDVLGHSFGGLQTLLFAISHPDRINRIVIAEGDAPRRKLWDMASASGSPFEQRTLPEDITEIAEITADPVWMSNQDLVNRYLVLAYRPLYADPRIAGTIRHGMDGARLTQMKQTSKSVRDALGDWDISADLATVSVPVLLIYGRQSIFETATAEALREQLPHANLVWVEGGHTPFIEDPNAFAAAVHEFLQN